MTKRLRLLTPVLVLALLLSGCSFLTWFDGATVMAQASGLSYPIVDTNQSTSYSNTSAIQAPGTGAAFYGQDAQIDGNQPDYVLKGDGTVSDLVTGLMWTQKADWNGDGTLDSADKMSYEEAMTYVDTLNAESYAGYNDWRMPTIKELYSLIDFSGVDINPQASSGNHPFINTNYFTFAYGDMSAGERIIDSQWATSTLYTGTTQFAGGAQLMFGVNFADGRIKGYPVGDSAGPGGAEKTYYILYVRGNTSYGINDFVANGDGTITDQATGLMWSQDDSGTGMDWEEALAYVQQLNDENYLGYSDWYLPNAKELQSIVDYDRSPGATHSAAIDPIFRVTSITNEEGQLDWGFYWTSTTHASQRGGQEAVYIAFGRGLGYVNGQFMDVHGAGCQRSDPKTGEPTYGSAPQGDVVRVANFVRVVRVASGSSSYASSSDPGSSDSQSNTSLGSSDFPNSSVLGFDSGDEYGFASEQGFILFAPLSGTTAYLVDRNGDVVHDWSLSGHPGNSVYLLEGGKLLATYTVSGPFNGGGAGGGIELLSWDGTTLWTYELATDKAQLHHDVEMLPNGDVLMISWEAKSKDAALAVGLSANQIPASGDVWSEMILEYSPSLDKIVWEWHLWDHVLPAGWDASEHPEKIDLSYAANNRSEDWFHINSVDYNADTDQIALSVHNTSEVWIIDHDLTTARASGSEGDLLYRFGNPAAYGGSGSQMLYAQHDAEWIADGLPGAGHLLVFNNGDPRLRPYSTVVEVSLPDDESGASSSPQELPATIVWSYGEASGDEYLFADKISGAQRLKNGNTLICNGTAGHFFEVTSDGETVWEYDNPYSATSPNGTNNDVFRCQAYSADYIGAVLAYANLIDAQVGTSSAPESVAQNVPSDEQSQPGTQASENQGPPGIASVSPQTITVGSSVTLTISLDPTYAPPEVVQFTSMTIGTIEATSWTRLGNVVRAAFTLPSGMPTGQQSLTMVFRGRNGQAVQFSTWIEVR